MNNRDFIAELSSRSGYSTKDTAELVDGVLRIMTEGLTEGKTVSVASFGTFEVRKKLERVVVSPITKQRMLVPPKLTLNFKPSNILKEKLK